jgi:plasmid stabilization system protein ParE
MAQGVIWSKEARADLRRLTKYLKETVSEEYADRITNAYMGMIDYVAEHPTKGMIIDTRLKIRRWKLDRHNYVTYSIIDEGIVVKNILPYSRNKQGFPVS